jgi:protease-4
VAQELRLGVRAFAASGKPTVAWAETFGATPGYLLACAFGEIWCQPGGTLGPFGIGIETTFLRGALDRLGLEPELEQRHEYKNAADRLLRSDFTEAHRASVERLAASVYEDAVAEIAAARRLPQDRVRELADRGPQLAQEALAAGLVDALAYRDEVYTQVRGQAGADAYLLYLSRYQRSRSLAERARKLPTPPEDGLALIYASGLIRRGRSGRGPLSSGAMGSDTVTAALRAATADRRARAIVLRVNSGGGSYVASDAIWREVVRARQAGKPVVVSMGDVAASGGYFIAMAANAIVAQPGTLTGSIGVLGGKPVTRALLERAGVSPDSVSDGAHADMFSTSRPFTQEEWAKVNAWLDRIYADFIGKVAQGRNMTVEQVDAIARGRVWTGADAAGNGLVDHLGGLEAAQDLARREAGLPGSAPVRGYPRSTPLDRLRSPESSEDYAAAGASLLAESWGPVWRLAAGAGLSPYGPLILPGTWPIR